MSHGPTEGERAMKRLGWEPSQGDPVWVRYPAEAGEREYARALFGGRKNSSAHVYRIFYLRGAVQVTDMSPRSVWASHVFPRLDGERLDVRDHVEALAKRGAW